MLNRLFKLPLLLVLCMSGWSMSIEQLQAQAKEQKRLSGSMDIDLAENIHDSYGSTQRQVQEFFRAVHEQTNSLASLGTGHIPEIDDNGLQFIGAVYLYCSVKNGICPVILNALLESDLITSKLRGNTDCPNMNRFWQLWLKNEMEPRQGYLVKIAHLGTVAAFKKNERPKYIRCKDTIEKQIASGPQPIAEFFKQRYAPDSSVIKDLKATEEFLQHIAEKVPDIYASVGIKFDHSDGSGGTDKSDKKVGKKSGPGSKSSSAKKKTIK